MILEKIREKDDVIGEAAIYIEWHAEKIQFLSNNRFEINVKPFPNGICAARGLFFAARMCFFAADMLIYCWALGKIFFTVQIPGAHRGAPLHAPAEG